MAYYQNTSTLFARSRQIGEANNLNQAGDVAQVQGSDFKPQYHKQKEREGRGGEGREREGREGKGREGKGREGINWCTSKELRQVASKSSHLTMSK
jgi:hypothetical protein